MFFFAVWSSTDNDFDGQRISWHPKETMAHGGQRKRITEIVYIGEYFHPYFVNIDCAGVRMYCIKHCPMYDAETFAKFKIVK